MYLSIKNEVLFNEKLSDKTIATILIMSGLRSDFDKEKGFKVFKCFTSLE